MKKNLGVIFLLGLSCVYGVTVAPAEEQSVNSSNVAVVSYAMDVNVLPQTGLLKVKAGVGLSSDKEGIAKLNFELSDQFKIGKITQADKPLNFSQDKWKITVDGVKVLQNPPPLVWEYEGTFIPPYKSDSMSDVIVYPDEVRLTYTSHWYPELRWPPQSMIKPSSKLFVEVPDGFTAISGDYQEAQPIHKNGRILYQYASSTNGSLSFVIAKYARTSIPW
jgi:hypothetical protein